MYSIPHFAGVATQIPYSALEFARDCYDPYDYGEEDEVHQV